VQAEYLLLDDCSEWKVVKELSELLPDLCISVFAETFIIEAIAVRNFLDMN
jgi:hypothetical protein